MTIIDENENIVAKSRNKRFHYNQESWLKSVYYFLERPTTHMATLYHIINFLLIIASIVMSVLSTMAPYENDPLMRKIIFSYEVGLLCWFTIEYLLRIWSSSFLPKYRGYYGKFRFIKTFYMLVDAFVIVSTLTTAILHVMDAYFPLFRITRLLQVFRVLHLDRRRGDLRTMGRIVYQHRKELVTSYFVGFIILFGGTYIIYICEKAKEKQGSINNMANGLYWAMITVTSVGYGDFKPETWAGKMLGGVFALVGCAFFALPAGILGSGFALQVAKQKKQERYVKLRQPAAIVIQNFWRNHAVHAEKDHLQATWTKFFPHSLAKFVHPAVYGMVPGIKNLSSYVDTFRSSTESIESEGCNKRLLKRSALFRKVSVKHNQEDSLLLPNNLESPLCRSLVESLSSPVHNQGYSFDEKMLERGSSFNSRKSSGVTNINLEPIANGNGEATIAVTQMLNSRFKAALRFILRVKFWVSIKSFKNVRYPFVNMQDIMEKSAHRHSETVRYLHDLKEQFSTFRREMQELRSTLDMLNVDVNKSEKKKKLSTSSKQVVNRKISVSAKSDKLAMGENFIGLESRLKSASLLIPDVHSDSTVLDPGREDNADIRKASSLKCVAAPSTTNRVRKSSAVESDV